MSTLTALKPRPHILKNNVVEIELVQAKAEDLKEFHQYGPRGEKIMKLRTNMVYWLKSSIKNEFEPTPRLLTADADQYEIKEWLDHGMIWIAKCWSDV